MAVYVSSTSDSRKFLTLAKRWLDQDESGNNTILSIANQAGMSGSLLRPPFWFAFSSSSNGDCGSAVFALPDGLVLSDMPKSHCRAMVRDLLRAGVFPRRIYAPEQLALAASALVSDFTDQSFRRNIMWRALHVERIIDSYDCVEGDLRQAESNDIDAIIRFGDQYDREKPSVVKVADYFLSRLNVGDLYLWVSKKSPEIRAVLALSGRTDRVIRIAGVFTPEKYRGNGYASSSIVRATNMSISGGYNAVTLVVDTSDSVASDMYARLGFQPIHDRLEMVVD